MPLSDLDKNVIIEGKDRAVLMGIATGFKQASGVLYERAQEYFIADKIELANELKYLGKHLEDLARNYLDKADEQHADSKEGAV